MTLLATFYTHKLIVTESGFCGGWNCASRDARF